MTTTERDLAILDCLRRTRTWVLVVLVFAACLIAAGLAFLRTRPAWVPLAPSISPQWFRWGLFGVLILSYVVRRVVANRGNLRDPATRAARFHLGHVSSAVIGALAAPLGLAYAFLLQPDSNELAPFWVVVLVTGALAFPRGYELDDFDEPIPRGDGSSGSSLS
jgi:hypothetical protein